MNNIQSELYDKCMAMAQKANETITKAKKWSIDRRGVAHYDVYAIRQWIQLQIAHGRCIVSNLEVIDSLNLGYVPEHLMARIEAANIK